MLTHTVQFRFKSGLSDREKASFMEILHELSTIPGVRDFAIFQQVSAGNSFEYLATMRFGTQVEYDEYIAHPRHKAFIDTEWIPKVEAFLEGDYLEWQA